jgi:hypothetical protein
MRSVISLPIRNGGVGKKTPVAAKAQVNAPKLDEKEKPDRHLVKKLDLSRNTCED